MGLDLFDRPSTADTGSRNEHDYYETPAWMTASLLHHQPIHGRVLEPCAGDGAIVRALHTLGAGLHVLTNDVDPRHPATFHHDATGVDLWARVGAVDWVITNPPFSMAFPILVHAERLARIGVAMLLRKTFLEPTRERGQWLAVHPPDRVIGQPRHCFRGRGKTSDTVASDWCIWQRAPDRQLQPFVIDYRAKERRIE